MLFRSCLFVCSFVHSFIRSFLIFIYFFINLFIYLLAVLVLPAARGLFSSCRERGLLFVAVRGLITAVASLVAEHGLEAHRLQ